MIKTNTAVYIYDHLISVLIAAAFIVFDHAKNKKIHKNVSERKGEMFEFWKVKQSKRQSKKIILEPNNKIDFIFVSLLELL